jgi:alpha-D-ribose 1-methylphosphonate 5-triphosphate synthase subunit PhnH
MASPLPSTEERRENAAFEALMWAFARPGTVQPLPEPGPEALIAALVDRECRVATDDPALADLVRRTGAVLAPAAEADHAFLAGTETALAVLEALPAGSALYPDEGATLVLPAWIGTGRTLRLTGPGVDGVVDLALGGLPEGFLALRARRNRYPEGVDIAFVDGARVVALPRSTQVEDA